jgi:hypothetical protein
VVPIRGNHPLVASPASGESWVARLGALIAGPPTLATDRSGSNSGIALTGLRRGLRLDRCQRLLKVCRQHDYSPDRRAERRMAVPNHSLCFAAWLCASMPAAFAPHACG